MERPRIWRRQFLINPRFQVGVALWVFFFILVYSFVLGLVIFLPLQQELDVAVRPDEQARIADHILQLHFRLWPAVLIVAILVGLQAIFTSHRMVGPLYRIERVLRAMAAGESPQRIELRRGDWCHELAEAVADLGEQLEQRRTRFLLLLQKTHETVEGAQDESTPEAVRRRLQEALHELQEAERYLRQGR